MSKPRAIEVFKPGRHTASNGKAITFTARDLQQIASSYNPALHEAPLVVGHPKHDAPAYGWTKALRVNRAGRLEVVPQQVNPQFAELHRAGSFKKISVSLYEPGDPNNPKPGGYYLRHVGFLGAMAPAVKGLRDAEFSGPATLTIDFAASELSSRLRAFAQRVGELASWLTGVEDAPDVSALASEIDALATEAETDATEAVADAEDVAADVADGVASELPGDLEPEQVAAIEEIVERRVEEVLLEQANGASGTADLSEPRRTKMRTPVSRVAHREPREQRQREASLNAREASLDAREKAQRKREHLAFLERTLESGRPLPCSRDDALTLLEALDTIPAGTVSFGENDERTPLDVFRDSFIGSLKQQIVYAEVSGGADFAESTNSASAIADRAAKYQAEQEKLGNRIGTVEAVRHVTKGAQ